MLSPKTELSTKNIKTDIPNIEYFIFIGILFNLYLVFRSLYKTCLNQVYS